MDRYLPDDNGDSLVQFSWMQSQLHFHQLDQLGPAGFGAQAGVQTDPDMKMSILRLSNDILERNTLEINCFVPFCLNFHLCNIDTLVTCR